jgi:prepilin-type N-terminal cleavage/methylation domain-containing protein
MKKNITKNKIGGFTLVEVLVSLAIFVIVTVIVGGTYMTFVQKQRDQLGMQSVQQDVQNFFDTLEREVRTGYGDVDENGEGDKVETNGGYLRFKNQGGNYVMHRTNPQHQIIRSTGTPEVVSSDRTYIQELKFSVPNVAGRKSDFNDGINYLYGMPTRVTVFVKACVDKPDNNCFTAQTSLSFRQLKPAPTP